MCIVADPDSLFTDLDGDPGIFLQSGSQIQIQAKHIQRLLQNFGKICIFQTKKYRRYFIKQGTFIRYHFYKCLSENHEQFAKKVDF